MKAFGRLLGACWRGLWWLCFPPLGWYLSRQAQRRRRHNATIRAVSRAGAAWRHGGPIPAGPMRIVRLDEHGQPIPGTAREVQGAILVDQPTSWHGPDGSEPTGPRSVP